MPRKKTEAKVIPEKVITTSPSEAIRKKCLECMAGQPGEVRNCAMDDCVLWPFRFGKNPFCHRGRNAKPEFQEQRKTRMKQWHAEHKPSSKS